MERRKYRDYNLENNINSKKSHTMKKILSICLAAAAFVGCTSTEVEFDTPNEIGLVAVADNMTRNVVAEADYPTDLHMFVYAWTTDQTTDTPNYINNGEFEYRDAYNNINTESTATNNVWGGVTSYYWPNVKKLIFSGYSGPDYGVGSSNSTLRYAYGDSPLGPWRSGGVLVDSRGIVLNQDGTALTEANSGHNTHGSIEQINGKWYAFYHRPPRGFGFARQPMVAPVQITWDEKPVAEGGKVVITGYDPYAKDGVWTAQASNGDHYTGAEVTSEGFQIYGLDPYKYYSAGYAAYYSDPASQQDSWDIWDNSMPVEMSGADIVGFKYFGFEGLAEAKDGLNPFEGAVKGNKTTLNVFLAPKTDASFKVNVWIDGPWDNAAWNGKKIGEIVVPAGSANKVTGYTVDVAEAVEGLAGKHAIYLVAEGEGDLCTLMGLGFTKDGKKMKFPAAPVVSISVNGQALEMPAVPVRSTNENGLVTYDQYEVACSAPAAGAKVKASADNKAVKVNVGEVADGKAVVNFDYNGVVKTYTVVFAE